MTTETNVAAQAGDEPMGICCYGGPLKPKSACASCAAWQVSPRATADVERLRVALDNLIAVAERCDSWESFPAAPLDAARAALGRAPVAADVEREAKRQAERVERLIRAAKVYTFNYLQDEHEEAELCTCGPKQHAELVELFAALAAIATTKPGA